MSYELEAYLAPLTALEGKQNHPIPEMVYRLTDELGLVPLAIAPRRHWRRSKKARIAVSLEDAGGSTTTHEEDLAADMSKFLQAVH